MSFLDTHKGQLKLILFFCLSFLFRNRIYTVLLPKNTYMETKQLKDLELLKTIELFSLSRPPPLFHILKFVLG